MGSFDKIPEVDTDASGVFKYILVELQGASPDEKKMLVRGYTGCNYHADINDMVDDELKKLKAKGELTKWKTNVLGGGRIILDSSNKTIKVYGYSQAYGKADHATTVELLRKVYDDYNITCSDEGY